MGVMNNPYLSNLVSASQSNSGKVRTNTFLPVNESESIDVLRKKFSTFIKKKAE